MDIQNRNGLIESFLAQRFFSQDAVSQTTLNARKSPARLLDVQDQVSLSRDILNQSRSSGGLQNNPGLLNEVIEEIDQGFRRTQDFSLSDGRTFTRTESFTASERGFERTVIQQNPSGSTIQAQEILDRDENGTFRRTQRFTNEIGETRTQIETGFVSDDPFVLSGGVSLAANNNSPFNPVRGIQVDLQA